jgi:hypothetical protein
VQDDPNLRRYDAPGRAPGEMPIWPEPVTRSQRPSARGISSPLLSAILALSVGANVALLIGLVAMLLLGRAGMLSPNTSAGQFPGKISATSTALSTQSPAPATGSLQIAPTSVQLGCDSGQQTQFAVLINTSTEDVRWRAVFSAQGDQAAVEISPTRGTLRAGTSTVIQIQNRSNSNSQQGTISFNPTSSTGGQSSSLSYTAMGC